MLLSRLSRTDYSAWLLKDTGRNFTSMHCGGLKKDYMHLCKNLSMPPLSFVECPQTSVSVSVSLVFQALVHSMDIFAYVSVCTANGMFALLLFAQHTGIHTTDHFPYVNWDSLFRLTPLGYPPPCCSLHPVLRAQLPLLAYRCLK